MSSSSSVKSSSRSRNVFLVIVDEFRYPMAYESPELKAWKAANLHFEAELKKSGTEFHNHYTNTNACVPARNTMQTGVYPSVHGCKNTDAVAKPANDPGMKWLEPFTVPTIGNYLRENGYKTYLKGKWHITEAEIHGNDRTVYTTYDFYGNPIPEAEEFYLRRNVLDDYGYEGWIGPEPHGRLGTDTASSTPAGKVGRDVGFTRQTIDTLDALDRSRGPWYLCANFLDPHDIAMRGDITLTRTLNFDFTPDPTLPAVMWTSDFAASMADDLSLKPATQNNYRSIYPLAFQPITDMDAHWRYYYTIQKRLDDQLMEVYNKLKTMSSYNDTVIIYTSDHGELLGAHGRLFQKWYQAYQEAIHVPLIISGKAFNNVSRNVYDFTSHIDLLPTILDISKTNKEVVRAKLQEKFSLAVPLPGRSIYPLALGQSLPHVPMYFFTEDDPTKGTNQISLTGVAYTSIAQPAACEAVISIVDGAVWKSTYYYNPTAALRAPPPVNRELYNLTADPYELNNLNLSSDPAVVAVRGVMNQLLIEQSFVYRNRLNQL